MFRRSSRWVGFVVQPERMIFDIACLRITGFRDREEAHRRCLCVALYCRDQTVRCDLGNGFFEAI